MSEQIRESVERTKFDWNRIRLPIIPDVARQCSEYLFSLPAVAMADEIKTLSETNPELLRQLINSPTFSSDLTGFMLTILRAVPQEYRDAVSKAI